ncbi:MAG: DUF2804 domain-containing protein [Candidatus Izemoplasmatales bacterium]
MQNQIKEACRLLDSKGSLLQPGFATYPYFEYHRKDIKASIWRIKEWDYYAVLNQDYGITCTVADLGYSAMLTVVFLDFKKPSLQMKTKLLWFTFGKMNMPSSSLEGNVRYISKDYQFEFIRKESGREIKLKVNQFYRGEPLVAHLILDDLKDDSMVIATPWKENPKAFYYNQKINCMPSSGVVKIGSETYEFNNNSSFAVLDWGRGVWTYKNTWYWSSLSSVVGDKRVGFNLGYGFGDTSKATENMVFVDGKAYKLDQVSFEFNHQNHMETWHITDNEGKLDLVMTPIIDRMDNINFGIIKNFGHQVFGSFCGTIKLSSKLVLNLNNVIGFAEEITNHY